MPRRFVWLLTLACSLTVANLYYTQPLLHSIAVDLGVSESSAGMVVSATQIGYAVSLVALAPLGDIVRRRPLVCGLLLADAIALVGSAAAPSLAALVAAGLVVGVTSVVVQILVPYAATVAGDRDRGRVISTLLTGMLVGVLLSRTFAGTVAQQGSWRTVYLLAALFMVGTAAVLYRLLPAEPPEVTIGYLQQMREVARVAAREPVLRRRSLIGAAGYASFNCFWTTSAFLLSGAPYHYDQRTIGLFGLVGAAGAKAAMAMGRVAGAGYQQRASGTLLAGLVASFVLLAGGGHALVPLLLGVVALDAAVQGVHVLNQDIVYGLVSGARARLTSVYMTSYFVGGGLGSAAGATAYHYHGWTGASVVGGLFAAFGLAVWVVDAAATDRTASGAPEPSTEEARR